MEKEKTEDVRRIVTTTAGMSYFYIFAIIFLLLAGMGIRGIYLTIGNMAMPDKGIQSFICFALIMSSLVMHFLMLYEINKVKEILSEGNVCKGRYLGRTVEVLYETKAKRYTTVTHLMLLSGTKTLYLDYFGPCTELDKENLIPGDMVSFRYLGKDAVISGIEKEVQDRDKRLCIYQKDQTGIAYRQAYRAALYKNVRSCIIMVACFVMAGTVITLFSAT